MSSLSFTDLVNEAWKTGKNAKITYNGNTYDFSPAGILAFIAGEAPLDASTIDITLLDFSSVPTTEPAEAGVLWANSGVLTISDGVV